MDLSKLTVEQRELLERRLAAKRKARASLSAIPRRPREVGPYPLSFTQKRLWIAHSMDPRSSAYHVSGGLQITGNLDPRVLERAIDEITKRQEGLRTSFELVDGEPVQVVAEHRPLTLPMADLRRLAPDERRPHMHQLAQGFTRRLFDLARGPLFRVLLIDLADDEAVLLVSMHHIVSDAESNAVFMRELSTLYNAWTRGQPSPLPELAIQYVDFAIWQNKRLEGTDLDKEVAYWREQFGDHPPVLELPTDRPRSVWKGFRGASHAFALSEAASRRLVEIGRDAGCTLFVTLLAALAILLKRYTGRELVPVSSPMANRSRSELERLIGVFVNVLVLPVDLSGDPTFLELLQRAKQAVSGAFDHQNLPTERVIEALWPERPRNQPMPQVALSVGQASAAKLSFEGLELTPVELVKQRAHTDLVVFLRHSPQGLAGRLEYDTDLFDASTMGRFAEHFEALVEAIVRAPEQRLSELGPSPGAALQLTAGREVALRESSTLTRQQLLLWAFQKIHPDLLPNNVATTLKILGAVDVDSFIKAFQWVVECNAGLRATFEEADGGPRQIFQDALKYDFEVIDFSKAREPEAEFKQWVTQRIRRRFDFSGPLFDSVLVKLAEEEFIWYFNYHQIISDIQSNFLILERLEDGYTRLVNGETLNVSQQPSFQAYLEYEKAYRQGRRCQRAKAFWEARSHRKRSPARMYGRELPAQSRHAVRVQRRLGRERTRALDALAKRMSLAPGAQHFAKLVLLAGITLAYLYWITGARRLPLGIPSNNRMTRDFENTVGSFMIVLPIEVTLEKSEGFAALTRRVRNALLEAMKHGQYTPENKAHERAYEVLLNYVPGSAISRFGGFPIESEWLHSGSGSDYVLALQVNDFEGSDDLAIAFDFDTDLFDDALRQLSIKQFFALFDALIEDPSLPVDSPHLISTPRLRERRGLLERRAAFAFEAQSGAA
ncbi:MAG: condensation domain-containing protein [Acidobacteriota bacterium]